MEDIRQQQIEALEVLKPYNQKLVKAVREVAVEFRGQKQPDTDEFFKKIMEGINWEIQVVNGTLDYINEGEQLLDKEAFNQAVLNHNDAIKSGDDEKIADSLDTNILPYLEKIQDIAEKKTA